MGTLGGGQRTMRERGGAHVAAAQGKQGGAVAEPLGLTRNCSTDRAAHLQDLTLQVALQSLVLALVCGT